MSERLPDSCMLNSQGKTGGSWGQGSKMEIPGPKLDFPKQTRSQSNDVLLSAWDSVHLSERQKFLIIHLQACRLFLLDQPNHKSIL